jgi:hypothetical protein
MYVCTYVRKAFRWVDILSNESYQNVQMDSQFQELILNRNRPKGLNGDTYSKVFPYLHYMSSTFQLRRKRSDVKLTPLPSALAV